jgi:hypothetical protein
MGGKGGGSSSTVHVHNGPVTVDSDSTVSVVGLDKIGVTAKIEPIKTESKQELVLPQPLKTESKLETTSGLTSDAKNAISVDLKPVAVDLCLNTSSKLPHGQIHQPFSYHVGWTLFGIEMFGVNYGGESKVILQDLPKKPVVDWPAQQNAPASGNPPHGEGASPAIHGKGLRVRVK